MSKITVRKRFLLYRKKKFAPIGVKYYYLTKVLKKFELLNIKKIGAYYPINYEIDCFDVLKKLEKKGYKISLPITKKKNDMNFFEWNFNEPLNIGKMGIPEPYQIKKVYPDILLVPLVAYDKYKHRLGYGGGYYDRYIKKISKIKKILTIGMAFSFQQTNKLKVKDHDKKLDFILTENCLKS